jgi:hypothetical protein
MKQLFFLLMFTIFLFSCKEKTHTIQLTNKSEKNFDSVVVYGGGAKISFLNVVSGNEQTQRYEVTDTSLVDAAFGSFFYAKDTTIEINGFAYHNGPADVPEKIHLVIDKDLKVKIPPTE